MRSSVRDTNIQRSQEAGQCKHRGLTTSAKRQQHGKLKNLWFARDKHSTDSRQSSMHDKQTRANQQQCTFGVRPILYSPLLFVRWIVARDSARLSSPPTNRWCFTHLKSNFKIHLLSLTWMLWGQVVLINISWGVTPVPPLPTPVLRRTCPIQKS